MKRFLLLTLALVGMTCACQKVANPEGNISVVGNTVVAPTGGDVTLHISSNCNWTISAPQGVVVNPSSGSGEKDVIATVAANTQTSDVDYTIEATFSNEKGSLKKSVKLTISANIPDPEGIVTPTTYDIDFCGGEAEFDLTSNCPWAITAPEGISVEPTSGNAGTHKIKVIVPENNLKELVELAFVAKLTNSLGKSVEKNFKIIVDIPYLSYDGVDYKIVKLDDGNVWMAENLRYVPAGFSASTDLEYLNGFYAPIVVNSEGKGEFSISDEVIAKNGFFYSAAIAFGLADDSQLTEANAASFEGCQGLCPEGWHIPTADEMIALVGKCANGAKTNPEAPYFDESLGNGGNGSIAKLNEDNANMKAYGAINIAATATAKGTMLATLNEAKDDFNTGYFLSSSFYKAFNNNDGSLKNLQFYGFMPAMKAGTINVAYNNYRNGINVRCIRNAK